MKAKRDILSILTILLLGISSVAGILSMDFSKSYEFTNQYGQSVQLFGSGLYRHDTYFKAPISIGTDLCILFVLVPLFVFCCHRYQKDKSVNSKLKLISCYGVSLYYAASIAFGTTYNSLFLVYVALFSCSLFGLIYHMMTLQMTETMEPSTGLTIFLILAGLALFIAWFPDIIPTLGTGKTLSLIGVYTTEITYVIDMGIMSPLCFLCIILLNKKKPIGTVLLAFLLRISWVIGVMMLSQTLMQVLSHADLPLAVLITKSLSFVLLGVFAYYYERKLYAMFPKTILPVRRRSKIFGILGGFVLLVVLYWNVPYSPFHEQFLSEMRERTAAIPATDEVCSAEEIASLPEPLQRYCRFVSLEGFPKRNVTRIQFDGSDFVMDAQSGKVTSMDYDLWLFQPEPYRTAFCNTSMFGIPFDGMDYCNDQKQGGMKGFLGKAVTLFDTCTDQGYQAVLISWLAESITFNPSILFSPYITYETVDDNHVKATVSYNGVTGTGIFTIDDDGAITEFYSDERQVEKIDGVDTRVGWKCIYSGYYDFQGIKTISKVDCIKIFPDREVTYFSSDRFTIQYEDEVMHSATVQ